MKAHYFNTLSVLSLVASFSGALCAGQAPAAAPAPAGSTLSTLSAQLSESPTFAFIKCYAALESVYAAYKSTNDWSKVPATPFNTSLYYVACHEYVPPSQAADSLIVYHPLLPINVTANNSGNSVEVPAVTNIMTAASAVNQDHQLFYAEYAYSLGIAKGATYVKGVLGMVVAGVNTTYPCICGVTQTRL